MKISNVQTSSLQGVICMIHRKRVLAIIPARGGSKGLTRKNIREVLDKPLIAWTIEEAKKSRYIDRLILSSEDKEIISVAEQWGCEVPFVRPLHLAQDETPGIDPVLHALKCLPGYDLVVLLQPTSPLRTVEDIDQCIEMCMIENAKACVSITEPDKSPYCMYKLNENKQLQTLLKTDSISSRQIVPSVYSLNGACYVADSNWLSQTKNFVTNDTVAYIMPKERSLDVDDELDLEILKLMLKRQGGRL